MSAVTEKNQADLCKTPMGTLHIGGIEHGGPSVIGIVIVLVSGIVMVLVIVVGTGIVIVIVTVIVIVCSCLLLLLCKALRQEPSDDSRGQDREGRAGRVQRRPAP